MPHWLTAIRANVDTLADVLHWRADRQPDEQIYSFLLRGETEETHLTYADLDRQARAISAALQETYGPGERALLWYAPGLEFVAAFFGCLYAGIIAVPISPPSLARSGQALTKLLSILRDARPSAILTSATIQAQWQARNLPELQAIDWIATDTIANDRSQLRRERSLRSDTPAFLQYTSGSTANPKGVILSHSNLLHNLARIQRCFEHTPESRGVIWLPPYHDMGLIGGILQPLYAGFPVTLMPPTTFLQSPLRWLTTISRTQATTSGGPNFAFELCLRKITPEQRADLDLSSWSLAFTGAEPIRAQTLRRFAEAFAPCGFHAEAFYPCYGLAEATLIVTGGAKAALPVIQPFTPTPAAEPAIGVQAHSQTLLVGCGQIQPEDQVRIVDPATERACQTGQIGEIWISGPCVAQGYWNNPAATRQSFGAHLSNSLEGPFLRTGDLGLIQNGELFITGRLKDLIIIRGRNYYPQDIELTVEQSHAALQPHAGAAFSVEIEGQERLVVVQEVSRQHRAPDTEAIAALIRQAVAEQHDLQVHAVLLVTSGSVPKTSSGKIQRYACRDGFLQGTLKLVGQSVLAHADETRPTKAETAALLPTTIQPETDEQRRLLVADYLRRQLAQRLQISPERITDVQPLSGLGLDSLSAIEIAYDLETELDVLLPLDKLLGGINLSQLAAEIVEQIGQPPVVAQTTSKAHQFAPDLLSHSQRALWFLHQLGPASVAYHIVSAARICGDLDVPALEQCFQALIDRHPALRTTFEELAGDPRQCVHVRRPADFRQEDATTWSQATLNERLVEETQRPFDLTTGPLLRIRLFKRANSDYVALLVIHHIVADFWSLALLLQELDLLYTAQQHGTTTSLPSINSNYNDYVNSQNALLASSEGGQLRSYWLSRLAGEIPVLSFPTDRPRPAIQTYLGATYSFELGPRLTQGLKLLSQTNHTTLYMTLLAAFYVLLYRYTGQTDILIGSPTADRRQARFARVVGYLVNPVVLRGDLSGSPSFETFLSRVRQSTLEAFAHQAYPFALLVEDLQLPRDPSRSPLFQVMFAMQKAQPLLNENIAAFAVGTPGARIPLGDLMVESIELEQGIAQFDLTLTVAETRDGLTASFQYNTDLFDADTIRRLADHFSTLIQNIAQQPSRSIDDLPLLTDTECQQIVAWNATATPFPHDRCIHELIEAQVQRAPEAIAVIFGQASLSYRELNERANQLARHLQSCGVGPESRVGICVGRSLDLMVGLLGILKAGGAYVPLDPAYPQERLQYMAQAAQLAVVLTQAHLRQRLPEINARIICLDSDWPAISVEPTSSPGRTVTPDNTVYIIYTSGSTGQPKGVAVHQRGLVNLVSWYVDRFGITADDHVLMITSLSFDLTQKNLFAPLTVGGRLALTPSEQFDPALILETIRQEQITILNCTPSAAYPLVEQSAPDFAALTSARYLFLGGEPIMVGRLAPWLDSPDCRVTIVNTYGPTECSDVTTFHQIDSWQPDAVVPIGRPVQNTTQYILDQQLNLLPVGASGELCIGGMGVGRGYINDACLTAIKFLPDPFSDQRGARLYRTGDVARFLPNGAIEYLGRIDHQVKLRGFRIELGEIEAALLEHQAVREAAVIVRDDGTGTYLAAYIVGVDSEAASDQALRDFLRGRLPEYMVPTVFISLSALPLSPNGKLDRRALPVPERGRANVASEFVAPRTPTEEKLAAIWAELLNVERVGVLDNFFTLGGHSLLVTQVVSRVRETFNVEIPMRTFFKGPTIADLAMTITQLRVEQTETSTIERLMDQISNLPAEQVQALLVAKQAAQTTAKRTPPGPASQQPAPMSQPVATDLPQSLREEYRSAEITHFPIGDGYELVSTAHRLSRILSSSTLALLEQCTTFKTIDDHARTIVRPDSSIGGADIAVIQNQLHDLSKDGFLLSYSEMLDACTDVSDPVLRPTTIATMAWPTCNRVTTLQRCLMSYIENSKHYGNDNDYAILDDSPGADTRQAYQDMLRSAAEQHNVRIFYGGIEQKTRFAERMIGTGNLPPEVVQYALFGDPQGPYRAGANVNALMLHTVGDAVLCVDDDMVGRVTPAPQKIDGVSLISSVNVNGDLGGNSGYPDEIWCFPDREAMLREIRFVETDLLGMHEPLLGQDVRAYLSAARRAGRQVDVHDVVPQQLRALRSARVMVTLPGLVGDCGWGTPSNYLHLVGGSRERLVRSEATYQAAITSRELLRVAQQVTLTKRIDAMIGSSYGLDNRALVPPSLPIAIGIDTIFGVTLSKCFDAGYFAHIPDAILHLPTEVRAFWPGEIMRSASGIAFNTLLSALINFFDFGELQADGETKLRRLGLYLEEVGSLPAADFEDLARSQLQRGASLYLLMVEERLQTHHEQPAYWAQHIQQFMKILRQSLLKDEFYVPLDLLYGRSLSEANALTRQFVRRQGQLMHWWPDIIQTARELRDQGYRLANPL